MTVPRFVVRSSRLLRAGGWAACSQLAPLAAMIVTTPLLIRHLGLSGYGLASLVSSIALALTTLDGGIGASALRYFTAYRVSNDHDATRRLFISLIAAMFLLALLLLAVVWVVAPRGAELLRAPAYVKQQAVPLIRLIPAMVLLTMLANVTRGLLQAHERWSRTASSAIAGAVVYATLALALVAVGAGPGGVVLALVAQQGTIAVLNGIGASVYLRNARGWWVGWSTAANYVSYSWRMQVAAMSAFVMVELDVLIVGAILPLSQVALYSIAAGVALQIQAVPMFLAGPFTREVTSIFASSGDCAAAEYATRFQRVWVPGTGIFLCVASSASWFVMFGWLGAKSSAAGGIAAVLLGGYLVNLWTLPMSGTALAVGKPGVEARYGAVAAVVNVALTVPGGVIFGVWGIAAGTAFGQVIGSLYLIRVYRGAIGPRPESFLGIAPYREMLVVAVGVSAVGLAAMISGLGRASFLMVVLSASVLALVGGLAIRLRSVFATGTHDAGVVASLFEEGAVV